MMTEHPVGDSATPGVVLIDSVNGEEAEFERALLEGMDHPVVVCRGPAWKTLCPLLAGGRCPTFEVAHGVVFTLDLDRAQHRAILRRYRELAPPDMPIRALVREGQAARYAELLENIELWSHTPTVSDLDGFAAEVDSFERFG